MLLSKTALLDAVRRAPLSSGIWVEQKLLPEVGACSVCAVGAVLRYAAGLPNDMVDALAKFLTDGRTIGPTQARAGRPEPARPTRTEWLASLSYVFERASFLVRQGEYGSYAERAQEGNEAGRADALAFIEQHFPDEVELPDAAIACIDARLWQAFLDRLSPGHRYEIEEKNIPESERRDFRRTERLTPA